VKIIPVHVPIITRHRFACGAILEPLARNWNTGGFLKQKFEDWKVTEINSEKIEASVSRKELPPLPLDISRDLNRLLFKKDWFTKGTCANIEELEAKLGSEGKSNLDYLLNDEAEDDVNLCKTSKSSESFELRGALAAHFPQFDTWRYAHTDWKKDGQVETNYHIFARWDPRYFEMKKILPESCALEILRFVHNTYAQTGSLTDELQIPDIKNARDASENLSLLFPGFHVSAQKKDKRTLTFKTRKKRNQMQGLPYVQFCLKKTGRETHQLFKKVQLETGLSNRDFGIAGTKDANGITCQFCTISGLEPRDIQSAFEKQGGCEVGNFSWTHKYLKLGDLSGNRFEVRIRNIQKSKEMVSEAIQFGEEVGFINYFGPQRFGFSHSNNQLVGKLLFQRNFTEAMRVYLSPSAANSEKSKSVNNWQNALQIFQETEDAGRALEMLSDKERKYFVNGQVLTALKIHGFSEDGCKQGFLQLPMVQRSLYPQAYVNAL